MPENNQELERKLTDFDADFSPNNPVNKEAASQRGWAYSAQQGCYVDEDGCLMADEYGQSL